ncbi:hypothetical protein DD238_006311 [Peronospora effusa]|uniref:Endonuclease/exonuclease/phosphatase domain-containing protein n=1 Tax=Peronospora effusa TaxID=542832 RepID=A0A3M6V821_9STRA|nr:hypothetical protein DD238_006311 [Peronospora effusa]
MDSTSLLSRFSSLFSPIFILSPSRKPKFSDFDHVRRADYFAHSVDAKARTFWSHQVDSDYSAASGKAGVGVVFSGRCPFLSLRDVTLRFADDALRHHYLVVEATIDDYSLFIHVVYAPVTVPKRKRFLTALPSNFPFDAHHLVLGDFNIPMGPVMDKVTAYPHNLGRAEFRDWLLRLGVLDAWRSAHPGRREFTGPGRRNRIDYCFVSPSLFDHYLRDVRHVTDARYGHEDHLHVRFLLH